MSVNWQFSVNAVHFSRWKYYSFTETLMSEVQKKKNMFKNVSACLSYDTYTTAL